MSKNECTFMGLLSVLIPQATIFLVLWMFDGKLLFGENLEHRVLSVILILLMFMCSAILFVVTRIADEVRKDA